MTIKLRSLLEENNILVPRNLDSRIEKQKQIDLKRIQEYIKNGSRGNLDLIKTFITKLPDNLTKVTGNLFLRNSSIEDLNNLEYVRGGLYAYYSKLKSLPPKLTKIGGILSLTDCPINNIDHLEYVGEDLVIDGTNINELPEGLRIEETLFCRNSPLSERFPDKSSLEKHLKERNIRIKGGIYL